MQDQTSKQRSPMGRGQTTYSVKEVAALLAVHEQTVRRWCREGTMPAAELGRGYRISDLDLQQWYQERGGGRLMPERTG